MTKKLNRISPIKITKKATRFAARRRHLKLSQASLARHFGVNPSTIKRWEAGKTRLPRIAELALEEIAEFLSVNQTPARS